MKSLLMLFAVLALWCAVPAACAAQGTELREVHGTVADKDEKVIPSAVVYLKNVRTLTVKTYISDDQGQYHFSGLDPNVDYELHAESGDLTSTNHTISSFDSRKQIVVRLKLDHDKKKTDK